MSHLTKTKSSELIDRIIELAKNESPSEFLIKKYEKEAEQLKKIDAVNAYQMLGMLAALRYDYDTCVSNHEASINLEPSNSKLLANYATSLKILGRFAKSIEMSKRVNQINSWTVLSEVCEYIDSLIKAGYLAQAFKADEIAKKIAPNEDFGHSRFLTSLREFFSFLEEEDIQSINSSAPLVVETALNVIYPIKGAFNCVVHVHEDESYEWINWILLTNLKAEDSIEANMQLCHKLAEMDNSLSNRVSVRIS